MSLNPLFLLLLLLQPAVHFVFTQARYTFTESDGRVEVTLMKVGETTLLVTATLTVVEGSGETHTYTHAHTDTDTHTHKSLWHNY